MSNQRKLIILIFGMIWIVIFSFNIRLKLNDLSILPDIQQNTQSFELVNSIYKTSTGLLIFSTIMVFLLVWVVKSNKKK